MENHPHKIKINKYSCQYEYVSLKKEHNVEKHKLTQKNQYWISIIKYKL